MILKSILVTGTGIAPTAGLWCHSGTGCTRHGHHLLRRLVTWGLLAFCGVVIDTLWIAHHVCFIFSFFHQERHLIVSTEYGICLYWWNKYGQHPKNSEIFDQIFTPKHKKCYCSAVADTLARRMHGTSHGISTNYWGQHKILCLPWCILWISEEFWLLRMHILHQ